MSDDLRREVTVIGLVAFAHFSSHFFQLVLAPLFPWIKDDLGVGYAALGFVVTVFYGVSGVCQTPAGFLVDRLGARPVLLGGLALVATALGLVGLAPSYGWLLPLAALAGVGNSVFHPSDYSILTARVSPGRLGRAYGMHALFGTLGWAVAPVVVLPLAARWGWRAALGLVGVLGLGAVLGLAAARETLNDRGSRLAGPATAGTSLPSATGLLLAPAILACFAFFTLLAMAGIGVQTFLVSALVQVYEIPVGAASGALTAYLLASAAGILLGGRLADGTARHDLVTAAGLCAAAACMGVVASGALPLAALIGTVALAGLSSGSTSASRDMLIRRATPPGASGRVFGFVYSGLDLGSSTGPLLFGFLLDHGQPQGVFWGIAGLMLLTIFTVVQVRLRTVSRAAA